MLSIRHKYGLLVHSRASNYKANTPIWPKFKFIQIYVLVTCKFEEDPIKTEGAINRTRSKIAFLALKASNSKVIILIWMEFKLLWDFMHVLVTCKFNKDLIKTEGAINRTTFSSNGSMGKFFVTQGQVTPKQILQSGPNSNFAETLCLSWLPQVWWRLIKIEGTIDWTRSNMGFFWHARAGTCNS